MKPIQGEDIPRLLNELREQYPQQEEFNGWG